MGFNERDSIVADTVGSLTLLTNQAAHELHLFLVLLLVQQGELIVATVLAGVLGHQLGYVLPVAYDMLGHIISTHHTAANKARAFGVGRHFIDGVSTFFLAGELGGQG